MTTTDIQFLSPATRPVWHKLQRRLRALLVQIRRRNRRARAYLELSHLDEALLYDLGIDPLELRQARADHRARAMLLPMRKLRPR